MCIRDRLRGLGERPELLQWGSGWIPGRQCIFGIFEAPADLELATVLSSWTAHPGAKYAIHDCLVVAVDRLCVDVMLMRDVESLLTALILSRVSQSLKLRIRRLSLFACTPSYVARLLSLLHRSVSSCHIKYSLDFLRPIITTEAFWRSAAV